MDPRAQERLRELLAEASSLVDAEGQMGAGAEERLRDLLAEASSLTPANGGRLLLDCGSDKNILWGDRVGFLRLGIGLASGALRPPKTTYGVDDAVDTDVGLLLSDDPRAPFLFRWAPDLNTIHMALDAKGNMDPRLRALLAKRSPDIPGNGARLLLDEGADGDIELWSDQVGFLRLGIGLASGALRPPKSAFGADDAVDTGVGSFRSDNSRAPFFIRWARDWTEIERVVHRKQQESEREAVIFFGVIIAIIYAYLYWRLA